MKANFFIQESRGGKTTLSEIRRIHELVRSSEVFCLYAYATQSGLAAFELEFGRDFFRDIRSRWLFGIDYGRTQPQAIRRICESPQSEVRIYDGAWLVNQSAFLPRRDFHLKTAFLMNPVNRRLGIVSGSGNFSSNGLRQSVEAGAVLLSGAHDRVGNSMVEGLAIAENLWRTATPALQILNEYERKWNESFSRSALIQNQNQEVPGAREIFWIETGYVTKNRGPDRPGNQIDLPRGMSRYFGLISPIDLPLNSTIGEITFGTPVGSRITRNLRLGNNSMEKITLPIPEEHGFDMYDGKVLVFRRSGPEFLMSALEASDFEASFGDRLSTVMTMGSGRRYGHIE